MRFSDTELAEFLNLRQATFLLVLGLLSIYSVRSKILSSFDKNVYKQDILPTGSNRFR